ncbi:MAG: DUF5658 family protein [Planctomycetaceae bacterium]
MSSPARDKRSRLGALSHIVFRRALPLERETSLFILVSAIDVFMTYILLRHEHPAGEQFFYESNPFADYFFSGWGVRGMVYFKFAMVAVVTLTCQLIARERLAIARWLLLFATAVSCCVVLYSLSIFLRHGGLL